MTLTASALPEKTALLYEAGVAQVVHLPPVGFKGFILLCLWVYQVLYKVVKWGAHSGCKRLVHCLWCIRLVAIQAQNVQGKEFIEIVIVPLELVSISGDETDKWVPDKQELPVVLQLCLQTMKKYTSTLWLNELSLVWSTPEIMKGALSICNFKDISDFIVWNDLHLWSWEAL